MIVRKQATLDRFEGKQAVLKIENNQELVLPKEELGAAKEGDLFVLQLLPDQEATMQKEELARTLLNQILQDDSQKSGTRS